MIRLSFIFVSVSLVNIIGITHDQNIDNHGSIVRYERNKII